ncbi:amino acid amidase [Paractinoplanes abujensis]|uniref:Proline iminopeptidase n=1 Tax=Paractinoplanes abujensis TaxID=882441 RepID=A0A7W7CKG9_9ACTN|nr:proline iminopeptidase-family hydrolase [Actinoplanes abujensis]MBB4689959.1 L-proline amide hydrolase [Actinoplanes abujensis]GID24633.1 amino acid amidase [Actinoplanes abujensis]
MAAPKPFVPAAKGTVPFRQYATWYRVTGAADAGRPALVVVHGGPGATHDYLLPLAAFAERGWPVVHYDQIGNGGSTHLPDADPGFWTPELFLSELDNLLRRLGIADNYVLFGQSWGGMLAARHASARPAGLRGLIVANAPASYPLWRAEMEVLRSQLPPGIDAVLRRHEAAGTTGSDEYLQAMQVFYGRHFCRLDPLPALLVATFIETNADPTVYHTMNGPNEFHVIGSLRDWSVIDDLPRIGVPTLVISGRHDEATPVTVRPYQDLIPDARWEIFEDSSHAPHFEEPQRFTEVLGAFLDSLGAPGAQTTTLNGG